MPGVKTISQGFLDQDVLRLAMVLCDAKIL